MSEPTNGVTYTVKELIEQMNRKLDLITAGLEQKADRERVHAQDARIAALELRSALTQELVIDVRKTQADVSDLQAWRNRLIGAFSLAVFLGATAFLRAIGFLG